MNDKDINNLKEMLVDFNEYSTDYTKTRCRELEETIENEETGETNIILRTNEIRIVEEAFEEIERLNNIIKEVREYIEERYNGEVLTHTFDKCNVGELLEILKGSNKE